MYAQMAMKVCPHKIDMQKFRLIAAEKREQEYFNLHSMTPGSANVYKYQNTTTDKKDKPKEEKSSFLHKSDGFENYTKDKKEETIVEKK